MPEPKPSPSFSRALFTGVLPLVAVAGATDALMLLHSKELLAVYMTGNTSKVGQFALEGRWDSVGPLLAIVATFLLATTWAAWIGQRSGAWRATAVLALSSALLGCSAPFAELHSDRYSLPTVLLIAAAIGALNQARREEPGVSFVTGVLVRSGRALAAGKLAEAGSSLLRWVALLLGAVLGSWLDGLFGTVTLLGIAAFILINALGAWPHPSSGGR